MGNGWYKRNNGTNALIQVVGKHESGDLLCLWAFYDNEPFRYSEYDFKKEFEPVTQEYVDSIERHLCPDHARVPSVFTASVDVTKNPNPDRWDKDEYGVRDCSYCGSIHPDDLISLLREYGFKVIERSDKSYKWYIHIPGRRQYKYYRSHDESSDFVNKYNALIDELRSKTSNKSSQPNA